jgi:DHA1 family multidrug resistance protein-like MFS transporter
VTQAPASPSTRPAPARGEALLVCALIGTAQMTWGVIVPVLPLLADDLALPVVLLGPIIAAFAIGRVIANVPAGMLMRRAPVRPLMLGVLLALAAVTAVTGWAADATWLIALRLVAGLLGGAAITLGFAVLLAGAPPERRGRVVSLATVVQMGAAAVGAVLGGAVVTVAGVPAAFVAAAVPVLLAVVWDLLRPAHRYWASVRMDAAAPGAAEPSAAAPPGTQAGLLAALAAVSFALFFARFAGEQGLIPVLAYAEGELDPLTLGVAFALGTAASAAVLPFVGRAVDRGFRAAVLIGSTVLAAGAMLSFAVLQSPWAFGAGIVAYAVATSVANIVPSVAIAEAFPGRRSGTAVGVTRTAGDLGAAAGPLIVFGLADAAGAPSALLVLAVLPLVAAVWLMFALRRRAGGRSSSAITR